MHTVLETWAEAHAATAHGFRRDAQGCASDSRRVAALLYLAAGHDGAAMGHAFRARELRYDARGGMTEELARRRFEPGARWTLAGIEFVIDRLNIFGLPLAHFRDVGQPAERADMTRANGWLFLGLGQGAQLGRRP